MAESEELKSLLMTVKEESEKVGLKLNLKKKSYDHSFLSHYFIRNKGGKVEAVPFYILGLQNHCRQ